MVVSDVLAVFCRFVCASSCCLSPFDVRDSLPKRTSPIPLVLHFQNIFNVFPMINKRVVPECSWGPTMNEPSIIVTRQDPNNDVVEEHSAMSKPPALLSSPFTAGMAKTAQEALAKYLQKPIAVKSSIGMRVILIPPGKFLMGRDRLKADAFDGEESVKVEITVPYYIGKFEVTQAEFKTVMGRNPSFFSIEPGEEDDPQISTLNFPVEMVSWDAANEFCQKLNEIEQKAGTLPTGWRYSLPTEAQWEYACRAGTTTETSFGDDLSSMHANFDGNSPLNNGKVGPYIERTEKVGSYPGNQFGLHDMHGNVSELCLDQYIKDLPGGVNPVFKPAFRFPRQYTERGGNWYFPGSDATSYARFPLPPEERSRLRGFRVVLKPASLRAILPSPSAKG